MAFWRPGAPQPAHAEPWDLDCDAEKHRALPVFNSSASLPVQQQRKRLPIARQRLAILHAVETHRAVVLCGATGCGKSTQLPQFLDEAGWTAKGYVVAVTVPRRLAAVTLATRVAQEMGVEVGREVGYRIRFDACVSPGSTRIEFMTEGILLREMLSDPLLTRFSVIVIDEAHERSSNTDLLLGLLKKICRKRPRLRIVVASATVDAQAFLNFFRSGAKVSAAPPPKRPRLRGWDDETGEVLRQRAQEADWRRLCVDISGGGRGGVNFLEEPTGDYVETAVNIVMNIHQTQPEGDILLFLTGREEIEAACAAIMERWHRARELAERPALKPKPLHTVPLHGTLPKEHQIKAFVSAPRGARKVVVSTNLAEASVTIDGIIYVIDSCMVKIDAFWQRAGRAGRTKPGRCFRLLTEEAFRSQELLEHTLPELQRSDLKDVVLMLKCLGVDDIGSFEFPTPPPIEALELALEELYALGAIDGEAWNACGPEGYVLHTTKLDQALKGIAEKIPCRARQAPELGRLFVEERLAEENGKAPVFVQMLRPQEGQVHFLYFWKAFGEAARIAGALAIEHDSLSVELEMLRDRVLRLLEESFAGGSSEAGNELPLAALFDEAHRAASMPLEMTYLLLSWLQDSALWEHRDERSEASQAKEAVPKGLPVFLHVYDVSQEEGIQKINRVLAHKHSPLKFGGVFHAGVEVNGLEWCFGYSGSETHPGVACVEPRGHPQHHYRQTVAMGYTRLSGEEDYDLLRRNCCHFADDFARRLGVGGIPGWVMRLAKVGAGVEAMIASAPKPIRQRFGFLTGSCGGWAFHERCANRSPGACGARLVEPLGLRMAHGPLPAPLTRLLLLSAEEPHSCAAEAAAVCAMLSLQAPWLPSQNKCQAAYRKSPGPVAAMVKALGVACLGMMGFARGQSPRTDVEKAFDKFLKDFDKDYDDIEKQARFGAFTDNYNYIQKENKKGHSYQLGLNEFSDMTLDEFKMNKLGMRLPESVWGSVASLGYHEASNASAPSAVDWRS
eukprot:s2722_g2.t2